MDRFARVVLGYHGCLEPLASELLMGTKPVTEWPVSDNTWDWLGRGVYFWEHAQERAWRWAEEKAARVGGTSQPAVVGAVIQLGTCFDLANVAYTEVLEDAFRQVEETYADQGQEVPENGGEDPDRPRRDRDCLVINYCLDEVFGGKFQTVRAAFLEGEPAFPGAVIRRESHIQIAVRDSSCGLGVFRPRLET